MTRQTPQEMIDRFVSTYTELYQDICKHSRQEQIPLTIWLLDPDFNTITSHQLDTEIRNPFDNVKTLVDKHKPIAYVIGGQVAMVKRVLSTKKSTCGKIDTDFDDKGLIEEVDKDIQNTTRDDVLNDPKKQVMLLIASSAMNIPNLKYGTPELFKGSAIDKMAMYVIKRDQKVKGRDYVTLELEIDSNKNKISAFVKFHSF